MNKEKRLMDIELDLETFQAHLKRLRRKPDAVHRLDVELLQEKNRKIYDKLFELEELLVDKKAVVEKVKVKPPISEPKPDIKEVVEKKVVREPEKKAVESPVIIPEPVQKPEEKPEKIIIEPPPPKVEKPKPQEVKSEVPKVEKKPEPVVEVVEKKTEISSNEVRSNIDLFTDSAEVSIGDKLGGGGEASIAARMEKSHIKDLKQAIGINEKFLFINELFNGDMGRYNKAISEFNELSTKEGTNAHLIELMVQNQWLEGGEAFIKLKDLLDRKFD